MAATKSMSIVNWIIVLILITCPVSLIHAQQSKINSLRNNLKTEKEDTNKVNTLNSLAALFTDTIPDSTISISQRAYELAAKLGWKKGEATARVNGGTGYQTKSVYPKALDYFQKALAIEEDMEDKLAQANTLDAIGNVYNTENNYPEAIDTYLKSQEIAVELGNKFLQAANLGDIGIIYGQQGNYPKAADCFLQALKIGEESGDKHLQANNLGNLGIVYKIQGEYSKALDYAQKALKLGVEMGNKRLQAINLGNISTIYDDQHDFNKALEYDMKSLALHEQIGDKDGIAIQLGNVGSVYKEEKDYPKALDYFQKSLKISEEIGDKEGQADMLGSIGLVYTKLGKFKDAEGYLKRAIIIDSSIGEQNELREWEGFISDLYDTAGQSKLALIWYKKATVLKDTLFNIDKNKALTRKEVTYQFEKKEAAAKAEQDKKDLQVFADKRKQRIITWSVAGGLLLVLVFAGFIFRSLRITRKQKQIIEEKNIETEKQKTLIENQKILVEEKNKDILDSITYAKRLQDAILPPLNLIKQYLPESFVLYKPKDIVAGDFYWMEHSPLPVGEGQGEVTLIAAADCTGHGVPGALVSVVCSNALNRTVKEFKITEPGKILDKVRELVLETFEKSESNVQDGMDISLASLTPSQGGIQLSWSGAYNSLWYIMDGKMTEIPADKQPIGKTDNPKSFTTHNITFSPQSGGQSAALYLFTDGFADQFGGPKGKKFKYKQLQEKLLAISHQPLAEQKNILEQTFEEWKGELEQVDDVLVIGIRV